MTKGLPRFLALWIVLVLVIAPVVYAGLRIGSKAPDFTLPTLDGKPLILSRSFKGHAKSIVVMDIWATWCLPCRQEIPYLVGLHKKYKGQPVEFVGVAIDKTKPPVESFVKANSVTYTTALDPNAAKLSKLYALDVIPAVYVIDKHGVIRYARVRFFGKKEIMEIDRQIQALLKK